MRLAVLTHSCSLLILILLFVSLSPFSALSDFVLFPFGVAAVLHHYFLQSQGLPTHDAEGKEVSKSQVKRLQKLQAKQAEVYAKAIGSATAAGAGSGTA